MESTWVTGSAHDDKVLDWLFDLRYGKDQGHIREALQAVLDDPESGVGECQTALLAAECVAYIGGAQADLHADAQAWLEKENFAAEPSLVELAVKAIDQIAAASELKDYWENFKKEKAAGWVEGVAFLRERVLTAADEPSMESAVEPASILDDPDLRKEIYQGTRARIETLWNASWEGDLERVKQILEEGNHDVNGLNRWQTQIDPQRWERSPLHAAAVKGHLELARYLLEEGAKVDPLTKFGDTPLHLAVENGHPSVVALLMEHGADPAKKNGEGETAAELAGKRGNRDVLQALATPRRAGG